jgi:hypothetical protein
MTDRETIFDYRMRQTEETLLMWIRFVKILGQELCKASW